jgi:hypothetical protein
LYGASFNVQGNAAAVYVDKIIEGAIPQPTDRAADPVRVGVNHTTAHAPGITIQPDPATQVTEWVD